ncbi:MAG: Ig-like domain-containing protein [Prolixibacteraceae bacterium]|jgi:hypothetical protein|nr:Ig-like domain-containing protein [Prolixibacteraceae bacterium]
MSKKTLLLFLFLFFTSFGYAEIKTFTFENSYNNNTNYTEAGTSINLLKTFTIIKNSNIPIGINGSNGIMGNTSLPTENEVGGFYMYSHYLYLKSLNLKVTNSSNSSIYTDKDIYLVGYLYDSPVFRYKIPEDIYNSDPNNNNGYTLVDLTAIDDLDIDHTIIDKLMFENPSKDVYLKIDDLQYDKRSISSEKLPVLRMVELSNIQKSSVTVSSRLLTYGNGYTERGFVYSTTDETPTESEGATLYPITDDWIWYYSSFSYTIENMARNTPYYVRAYVKNKHGIRYSFSNPALSGESTILQFKSNGKNIENNSDNTSTNNNTNFGDILIGNSKTNTYTIKNIGSQTFNITSNPFLSVEQTSNVFSITEPSPFLQIAGHDSKDFTIEASTQTPGIYRKRIKAKNGETEEYSFVVKATFYKKAELLSSPSANVEQTKTTIIATIAPNFNNTSVEIEYGLDQNLDHSVKLSEKLFSRSNSILFSIELPVIKSGATHYYRIKLVNDAGETTSSIYSYESIIVPPSIDTNTGFTLQEGETHILSSSEFKVSDNNLQIPTITISSIPQHGALYKENTILSIGNTFLQDDINTGKITYVHDATETSSDSFTLSVKNSLHALLPETVNISITNSNDAPIAIQQTRIGEKNIPVTFTKNHFTDNTFDEEGDPLTKIKITSLPTTGSLTLNSNPIIIGQEIPLSGTANIEYIVGSEGIFNFTWKAFTNTYSIDSAAIIIEISKDLTPPVITDWSFTINEDELTAIPETKWTENYTDTEPLAKIALISSDPEISFFLGSVPLTLPAEITANQLSNLKCISAENFNGIAKARWDASDGTTYTDGDKQITFTITTLDDSPTAEGFTITGTEETDLPLEEIDFTSKYIDIENDPFTSIKIDPSKTHGLLKVDGSNVTTSPINVSDISKIIYTPIQNSYGNKVDSIYYKVINANAESTDWYVIYIDLNGVNDNPTNQNLSFSTREDNDYRFVSLMFSHHYSDPENDPQESIKIVSLPDKGALRLNGIDVMVNQEILISEISNLTFTPIANEYGTNYTTFEYQSKDGSAFSPTYTVTANVTSVTDPIVLGFHNALTFTGNGYVDIKNLNDFPNSNFTFEMMVKPTGKNLHQVIASSLENRQGWEIGIDAQNHWYITYGDVLSTHTETFTEVDTFDKWYKIVLVGGATPSISIIRNTTTELNNKLIHTLAIGSNTEIVLGKNRGQGNNYFTGVIDEVYLWSKIRTKTESLDIFKIISSNEPGLYAYWDCNDIEGIKLKDDIGTHNGIIQGDLYYESTGHVVFDVTDEEVPLTTKMKYTDWDNQQSQVDIGFIYGGSAVFTTSTSDDRNTILYTPKTNFSGISEVIYQLNSNNTLKGHHYIKVNNVDDLPEIIQQTIYLGDEDFIAIDINRFKDNFIDHDNDPLDEIIIKSLPSNGTLSHNGVNITIDQVFTVSQLESSVIKYTPNEHYSGVDSISWNCIANSKNATTDAKIYFNVQKPINPIILKDSTIYIREDETITLTQSNISEMMSDDSKASKIAFIESPSNGYISKNGVIQQTPFELDYSNLDASNIVIHFTANWNGQDTIRWDIKDNNGYTDGDATIAIHVVPINDIPEITDITIQMTEDVKHLFKTTIFSTNYYDLEGDEAHIVKINSLPLHGELYYNGALIEPTQIPVSLQINTQGLLEYIPKMNYYGKDNVKYQVQDILLGTSNEANLIFDINEENDAPKNSNIVINIDEDNIHSFSNDFNLGYSDEEGDELQDVIIKTLPILGKLLFNGIEVTSNQLPLIIPKLDVSSLTYSPNLNESGTPYVSFIYSVTDKNNRESLDYYININVKSIEDTPEISGDIKITLDEDHKFYFTDHIFKDVFIDYEHYGLQSVKITTIESGVTLEYNNTTATVGTVIPIADITQLCYTPNANENAKAKKLFTFTLIDSQNTETSNTATCMADIIPVNDPPIITDLGLWTVKEGTLFSHTLEVTNPDQDQLTYSIVSGPVGMTISNTGVITWQANVETDKIDDIVIRISDGIYNVDLNAETTIQNVNNKLPVVTTESITLNLKNLDSATKPILTATDKDFGTTTFQDWTIVSQTDYDNNGQDPFSIDPQTGELSYNDIDELYIENNPGYTIQVTVSDGVNTSVTKSMSITLNDNRLTQTVAASFINGTDYDMPTTTQPVQSDAQLVLNYTSSDTNVATVNGNLLNILSVGTTQIEVKQEGNHTYKPFSKTFTFTVYKASITVTAKSETRIYGVSNPTFTYEVTGARIGDTNIFTTEPTLSTTATETSNVGIYPITIIGGVSDKYDITTYKNGTLNITKAEWNATWTNYKPEIYINETIDIQISELATYTVSSDNVIVISVLNHNIKGNDIGASDITISIEADINHNAQDIIKTVSVINEKPVVTSTSADIYLKSLDPDYKVQLTAEDNDNPQSILNQWELRHVQDKDNDGIVAFDVDPDTGELIILDYDELICCNGNHAYNFEVRVNDGIEYSNWTNLQINIYDNREEQTVSGIFIQNAIYTDLGFNQPETSDQGIPLTYNSADNLIAKPAGRYLEVNGIGSTTIEAKAAGNNLYRSYEVTFTFTVAKAPITVTAENKTRGFEELEPTFTYMVSGARAGDTDIYSVEPTLTTDATMYSPTGDYNILISGGTSDKYIPNYVNGTLTITKAEWNIVWTNEQTEFNINETLLVELSRPVSFTVSSDNTNVISTQGATLKAEGKGNAKITISIQGDINHNPKVIEFDIHVVNQKPIVTSSSFDIYLKGLLPTDNIQFTATDVDGSNFERWEARYIQDKDNNSILPATMDAVTGILNITDYDELFKYGDHTYNFQVRVNDGISYSDWKDIQINIYDNRDLQNITASYIQSTVFTNLEVMQPEDSDQNLPLTYHSSDENVVSVNANTFVINRVGSSVITVEQSGNNEYLPYSHSFAFTVVKAPITVTADSKTRVYGDMNPMFTYSVTGTRSGDTNIFTIEPNMSTTATETSNVGQYTIAISGGMSDNYMPSYINGNLDITKATWADVTWINEQDEFYTNESLTILLSEDVDFTLSSDNSNVITTQDKTITSVGPGSATVTISIAGDTNHDPYQIVKQINVVTQKPVVLTSVSDIYLKGLLSSYTIILKAEDPDTPLSALTNWEIRNVEDKDNNGNKAFRVNSNTGELTINDYDELFMYGNHIYNIEARVSDGVNYSDWKSIQIYIYDNRLTQSFTSDFIDEASFTDLQIDQPETTDEGLELLYTSSDTQVVDTNDNTLNVNGAGTTVITVTQEGDNQYKPFQVTFTITIDKAPITVTADEATRVYGIANPNFSYSVTGARNGDNQIFTIEPTFNTPATETSDVGEYDLTISGGASDNYITTFVNSTMTITKANWNIIWVNETLEFEVGETLTVQLSKDVDFIVTTSETDIVYPNEHTIEAISLGDSYIAIHIPEDKNHFSQVIQRLLVVKDFTSIKDDKIEVKLYPNPAKDYIYISGLQSNDLVQIISINGRTVKEKRSTENLLRIATEGLANGLYLIQINHEKVYKLVISK